VPQGTPQARETKERRDRDADLAAIDALIDRLVPALTAKLGATHLGELEVREEAWRLRLRRPATAGNWNGEQRRSSDRGGRGVTGHDHAGGRAAVQADAHRVPNPSGSNGSGPAGGGSHPGAGASHAPRPAHEDDTRRVATSPAVGVFHTNTRSTVGTRVREGDVLGHVDVLGVREDVLSPVDGLVGEQLTEAGTAVEYGQELVVIAIAAPAEAPR
jgi:biotin carboxyl carrier protein